MNEDAFRQKWLEILEECQRESIPRARLPHLALAAGPEDVRFLLEEAARIDREWTAIRDTDAGDGSDEYWRMAACIAELFKMLGAKALPLLTSELRDRVSPYRTVAARVLQSSFANEHREEVRALLAMEKEPG